jgi:V/A-type H+-transporting ATPase subunit K
MNLKGCWIGLVNFFFLLLPAIGLSQEALATGSIAPEVAKWGFMAAAVAVGASSLGAGIAVALVGSAAMGALSERPEMAGRALIFLGLAEGIAIYGLIVAIMILGKI